MKTVRVLCLALAVMLAPAAVQAQLSFGVKGGVNIATVKFDRDVIASHNITGFQLGPMLEYVKPSTGWGMDVALLFMQKGFEAYNRTVKNNYLEIPLNLKWKIMTPLVKPYASAGPYAGFRMGGRKIWEINDLYNDVKGQLKAGNFSAGLNFAAGVEVLSFLQVGLNYDWGLTGNYKAFDVSNPQEYTGKSHTWSLSAAVLF
ncbi:MAG: PorT family protein [Tannerella sp.]|jgi:hypothetical protein|nr:PorT family protein [Tannerella sp.]